MTANGARFSRYLELQQYVGWTPNDAARVAALSGIIEPALFDLVEDFYDEVQRHPEARQVITGGADQVERLKRTLAAWLCELFSGRYDEQYVERRWRVGNRHVEIGLHQVYTNVALSRLRTGLVRVIRARWPASNEELKDTLESLHKLLDLDLAIIEDAYQGARLRAIHDAAADGIVTFDSAGIIDSANPAASEMFSSDNLVGRSIHEFVKGLQSGDVKLRQEVTGRRPTGAEFPIDASVSELAVDGHRLFTAILRDVSELKLAQRQLLQSERLAAIGKAMAGLVHESRNALQRSQAGLERLARRIRSEPGTEELIQGIQRAQDDLHRLYEEVREYAAPVRIVPQMGSIDSCLRDAWDHLFMGAQETVARLRVKLSTADVRCTFDPFAMRQVFRNVLENAIAACRSAPEVEVRYVDDTLEGREALSVMIRDNGPGLSEEQQAHMFEEFYTTKTRGTGLGLPIARRLVEAHSGRITATSIPGSGAEIQITLPRQWK